MAASLALTLAVAVTWAGSASAAYPGAAGRIAFVRGGDIYTIEPNGVGLARLTDDGHASGPRWSPRGTAIAYVDGGNLWVIDANGSHNTRLTHNLAVTPTRGRRGRPTASTWCS